MELQPTLILCPVCNDPLKEVVFQDLTVSRCERCKGFFAEEEKVADPKLLEFAETEMPPKIFEKDPPKQELQCPYDAAQMVSTKAKGHPGLVVQSCPTCQRVWMDGKKLYDFTQQRQKAAHKRSSSLKYVLIALAVPGLYFMERGSTSWLLQHCGAETLKGLCIISGVIAFFSLFGLGLAGEEVSLCRGGGCCRTRGAMGLAIVSVLSEKGWKIVSALFIFIALLFFIAWSQHPDRMQSAVEPHSKTKPSMSHHARR